MTETQPLRQINDHSYGQGLYAQRHADNGTPVDVLRELMDHRSVDTTMGYTPSHSNVNAKPPRRFQFAIDRHGRPAGLRR